MKLFKIYAVIILAVLSISLFAQPNRLLIDRQLQQSVFPFSTIVTDASNNMQYVVPGTEETIFAIVGGVPTWTSIASLQVIKSVIEDVDNPSLRSDNASMVQLGVDTFLIAYGKAPATPGDFSEFYIATKKSYDAGRTWIEEDTIFQIGDAGIVSYEAVFIPSLLYENDTLHIVFLGLEHTPDTPAETTFDGDIFYSHSLDDGLTWITPTEISGGGDEYHAPGGDRLTRLNSNRLIYSTAVADSNSTAPQVTSCHPYRIDFIYSDDNGSNWVYIDANLTTQDTFGGEAGIYQVKSDTLVCYFRTCEEFIFYSKSSDDGATWGDVFQYGIMAANSHSTVKYIPELDIVFAAYAPTSVNFEGNFVTTGSLAQSRKKGQIAISYDEGSSFTTAYEYFSGVDTSLSTYEPALFWDTYKRELHVVHSPTSDVLNNNSLWDYIIPYDRLNPTAKSSNFNALWARYGIGLGTIDYSLFDPKPKTLLDVYLAPGNTSKTFNGIAGARIGNDNDFILFGDADNSTSHLNRIQMHQSITQTGSNSMHFTHDNVSASLAALKWSFAKNGGLSDLAATDRAWEIRAAGNLLALEMKGNGDMIINTDLNVDSLNVNTVHNAGSEVLFQDGIIISRPGAQTRMYAIEDTPDTQDDLGIYSNGGDEWKFSNWGATVGLMWDGSSEYVNLAKTVRIGTGLNGVVPVSTLEVYEDNANVGTTVGLTIEQDGTGDAITQYLLTGGQRWVLGTDNDDSDKFKLAQTADLASASVFEFDINGIFFLPFYNSGYTFDNGSPTSLIGALSADGELQGYTMEQVADTIQQLDGETDVTLAAAADTLVITSSTVTVTGDGGANTLVYITGGYSGQILTLIFVDALVTITDTAAATADTANLSAAFTSTADDTITFRHDGNKWFEIGRSLN